MRRFYYFIIALMLALLPDMTRAQSAFAAYYEEEGDSASVTSTTKNILVLTYGTDIPAMTYDGIALKAFWRDEAVLDGLAWKRYKNFITKVVIDDSFADARPTTCAGWFGATYRYSSDWNTLTSCSRLIAIEGLENLNTSEVVDMRQMFAGCACTTLDVSSFDTSKVTNMYGMFCGAQASSLNFSNWDTSNVTNFMDFLTFNKKIVHINVSSFNFSKAKTMRGMFAWNSVVYDITFGPNANTQHVPMMENMFLNCRTLFYINGLQYLDTSSNTSMEAMFLNCWNLQTLDLSNFHTDNVTTMNNLFNGCTNIKSIKINRHGWNLSKVKRNQLMFLGCAPLKGGNGTTYNASHASDLSYARIDAEGTPGYFTASTSTGNQLTLNADATPAYTLEACDGEEADVRVLRTFTADKWETITLPFNVDNATLKAQFGDDVSLKTLSSATHNLNNTLTLTFADATVIEAGKPYLIKVAADVEDPSFTGVTIDKTLRPVTVDDVTMNPTWDAIPALVPTDEANGKLFTPAVAGDYETLIYNDQTASVNGLGAYFTSYGIEFSLTVSDACLSTLCLPYNAKMPTADYFNAAIVTNVKAVVKGTTREYVATMKTLKNGIIPANTGVVIMANPGTYRLVSTEDEATDNVSANMLGGVTVKTAVSTLKSDPTDKYYVFAQGTLSPAGLKLSSTAKNCAANKAYMVVPANYFDDSSEVKFIGLSLVGESEEDATAIRQLEDKTRENVYYNLNGQRVEKPTRGIYIVNGKKVLVK